MPEVVNDNPENSVQSTGSPESRGGSLRLSVSLSSLRFGELQQRGTISSNTQDRTGDGAALRDASVSLCGGGLKHALLCTTVSVCECVNVFECVSQCLVYGHNALLFYSALPPAFPASRQPLSQPCSPAHPSNSAILFFLLSLTCSFMTAIYYFLPHFFLFSVCLWVSLKFSSVLT